MVRADGRVEILDGDGLPLGLFADAQPNHADLELSAGDLLFFYTDGVTEARNAAQQFFEDQLADALAADVTPDARRRPCAPSRNSSPRSRAASSGTTSRSSR